MKKNFNILLKELIKNNFVFYLSANGQNVKAYNPNGRCCWMSHMIRKSLSSGSSKTAMLQKKVACIYCFVKCKSLINKVY